MHFKLRYLNQQSDWKTKQKTHRLFWQLHIPRCNCEVIHNNQGKTFLVLSESKLYKEGTVTPMPMITSVTHCNMRFITQQKNTEHESHIHRWNGSEVGTSLNTRSESAATCSTSPEMAFPNRYPASHGDAVFCHYGELFVTKPFHMQMLCLWFLLIRHSTLAVG